MHVWVSSQLTPVMSNQIIMSITLKNLQCSGNFNMDKEAVCIPQPNFMQEGTDIFLWEVQVTVTLFLKLHVSFGGVKI